METLNDQGLPRPTDEDMLWKARSSAKRYIAEYIRLSGLNGFSVRGQYAQAVTVYWRLASKTNLTMSESGELDRAKATAFAAILILTEEVPS